MSARLTKAIVTISVDVDAGTSATQLERRRSRDAVLRRLSATFAEHQVPVAWSTSDPASAPRLDGQHELALTLDASWAVEPLDRATISRELARRVAIAQAAGRPVLSLVLADARLTEHLDLAVKHGITGVRHPAALASATASKRMQASRLRFGLWSFPVSVQLPGASRWLPGGGGGHSVRRLMDRAIAERGLVHVAIDASQLAERGRAGERVVTSLLSAVDKRRSDGVLEVATIGATAARLAGQQSSRPSSSILRPAA